MIKVAYKNYVLGLLVLVGTVTMFERFIFALVLEPIKKELLLSDSQLGLMTGLAFAGFYAIAGIPIARWADTGNRSTITALAVGLLGLMVSLCGMVGSFFQLLLVRAGVAIGEAGVVPAGQSLLSDYFDRSQRPFAMAIYSSFFGISIITGYLLGGYLVEAYGWRLTFVMMGLPGIVVAVIVKLTLKEPRLKQTVADTQYTPSYGKVARTLYRQATFRQIFIGFCVAYFFNMGTSQWVPTFFIRSYGMTSAEVGAWLALTFGGFGILGVIAGGHVATRYLACKERLQMRLLAISSAGYGLATMGVYVAPNQTLALSFIALSAFIGSFGNGPVFAAIHALVNERMRSLTVALTFLFANLIGFGLGPLALGILSDALYQSFGQESLRYALLIFAPGSLWMAFHYWRASNTIESDIGALEPRKINMEISAVGPINERSLSNDSYL